MITCHQSISGGKATNEYDDVNGVIPKVCVEMMVNEYEGQTSADHIYRLLCDVVKSHELLRDHLIEANGLLRSAHSIGERAGVQTNWDAFKAQIKKALDAQHAIVRPIASTATSQGD